MIYTSKVCCFGACASRVALGQALSSPPPEKFETSNSLICDFQHTMTNFSALFYFFSVTDHNFQSNYNLYFSSCNYAIYLRKKFLCTVHKPGGLFLVFFRFQVLFNMYFFLLR